MSRTESGLWLPDGMTMEAEIRLRTAFVRGLPVTSARLQMRQYRYTTATLNIAYWLTIRRGRLRPR